MADRPADLLIQRHSRLGTGCTPSKPYPRSCAATWQPTVTGAVAILPKIIKKPIGPIPTGHRGLLIPGGGGTVPQGTAHVVGGEPEPKRWWPPVATRPRPRNLRDASCVGRHAGRRGLGRGVLAAGVRRPRRDRARAARLRRGDHTRASASAAQRDRDEQHRAGDHAVRHRSAEAPAAPPHGARRRHLVSGHVGAGSRLRPRVAAHPRGAPTATTTWSTARRSGRRWGTAPIGVSSTCAPIPTHPSTRASPA